MSFRSAVHGSQTLLPYHVSTPEIGVVMMRSPMARVVAGFAVVALTLMAGCGPSTTGAAPAATTATSAVTAAPSTPSATPSTSESSTTPGASASTPTPMPTATQTASAVSTAEAVWVAVGIGVGVDAEAPGVVEDSEVEGVALGVDGAAVTADVAVVAAGAAPVVEGPQPASRVRATTAKPATTRAMGLRIITTPISGVDTWYGRSVCDPCTAERKLMRRHRTDTRRVLRTSAKTRTTTVGMS